MIICLKLFYFSGGIRAIQVAEEVIQDKEVHHQELIQDKVVHHQELIQDRVHRVVILVIRVKVDTQAINSKAVMVTIHLVPAMHQVYREFHRMCRECSMLLIPIIRDEFRPKSCKLPYKTEKVKDSLINVVNS